jgi:hypothetical protein
MRMPEVVGTGATFAAMVLIPLVGGSGCATQKVTLRQKFTQGSTTRMTMTTDMNIKMDLPGQDLGEAQESKMAQTFEMLLHVSDIGPDGTTTLEMTYDRIKQSIDMGGRGVGFDSKASEQTAPEAKMMAATLKPLLGLRVTIKLDKDLHPTEVKGFDELWKRLDADPASSGMRKQVERAFGDKQIKKMMEQFMAGSFPSHPVAVGESWKQSENVDMPMIGELNVKATSTLEGIEQYKGRRCAKIRTKAEMTSADTRPTSGPTALLGMKMRRCNVEGFMWFDIKAGQMIETDMDQDIVMSMQLPGAPGASAGQPTSRRSMEQHIRGKTRIVATPEPTTRPK